jgi:hypothetical protein
MGHVLALLAYELPMFSSLYYPQSDRGNFKMMALLTEYYANSTFCSITNASGHVDVARDGSRNDATERQGYW